MKNSRVLMMMLILCCMVMSSCSKKPVFEGYVAQKLSEPNMILVISNISDEVLENGTQEEIMEIAYEQGMFFYVSKRQLKNLEIGQKVAITYNGKAQESLPPKTGAERIEVLEE